MPYINAKDFCNRKNDHWSVGAEWSEGLRFEKRRKTRDHFNIWHSGACLTAHRDECREAEVNQSNQGCVRLSDNASHRSLAFEMRGGAIPQPIP